MQRLIAERRSMLTGFRARVCKFVFYSNIPSHLHLHGSIFGIPQAVQPLMMRLLCSCTSTDGRRLPSDDAFDDNGGGDANSYRYKMEKHERTYSDNRGRRPKLPPDQQQRGRWNFDGGKRDFDYSGRGRFLSDKLKAADEKLNYYNNRVAGAGGVNKADHGESGGASRYSFPLCGDEQKHPQSHHQGDNFNRQGDDDVFLGKFKLDQLKNKQAQAQAHSNELREGGEETKWVAGAGAEVPPEEAEEIFKKMKETGLIPNAVAMLHGLCNDGLVQEAMKLFGSMREKGTIPEVVIYTAVVEGFCKAQKFDDAKRIFRKMHNNGVSPNAFSYAVLVQGLSKGKRLDDALELCVEMLEAGHSPNLATFTGLVDGFCRERGLEAAQTLIATLRHKGFFFDEKAVREFLDKKGPFFPMVWEAIFGKKSSQSQRYA